jgi:hypothetical protein
MNHIGVGPRAMQIGLLAFALGAGTSWAAQSELEPGN